MGKICVEISKSGIILYIPNKKGKAESYIKYRLLHLQKPFDGGIYQNYDLYRLCGAFATEYVNGEFKQTLPYMIVSEGEWECALCLRGTRDFHGGIHGYEHKKEVFAEADGKPIDLEAPNTLWVDSLRFVQKSVIVKQETLDKPVCNHIKDYLFSDGGVTIKQDIEWLRPMEVSFAYLAMFPIRRTHDDTETGEVISDRVMTNLSDKIYDVGRLWHETDISPLKNAKEGVSWAKIWGEKSGITAEMWIVENDVKSNNIFFVQNNQGYNKLYYSCAGNGTPYPVCVGDKWHFESRYEIYRV
ncbi:MAG: hypothetical protein J6V50_00185 [Clostridia bacterium]|nr:hypothetical protein [Clostridia bacterium]